MKGKGSEMKKKGDVNEWKRKGKKRKLNGNEKKKRYHDFKTCQHFPFCQNKYFLSKDQ